MGVHGLWRLIEPAGKPVPLETLENKVLAVDVSIWLHQLVKGFQDAKGAPLPNAHLLGIYHRICKLLYFRIRPVFVFDGGVPVLKKQTMAKRHQQKTKTLSEAERIHRNLLTTLLKHSAISKVLSEKAKAAISASLPASSKPTTTTNKKEDDLYMLPPSGSLDSTLSSSEDEESSAHSSPTKYDLHSIDTQSAQFKSLPVDVRHEILTDLKETRKQSSWGRLHELPTESDDFAIYQMKRLLKRQSVQTALEGVEKEMGGHSLSLGELEKILKDQGVISNNNIKGSRIASDENTRFLLIKDIKQAVEEAKKQNGGLTTIREDEEEEKIEDVNRESVKVDEVVEKVKNKADAEYEEDLQRAIALSMEEEPSTSEGVKEVTPEKAKAVGGKGKSRMPLSFLEGFTDADFFDSESEEDELTPTKLTPAQRYMMEYSGLTAHEISRIIASKKYPNQKSKAGEEAAARGKRLDFDQNDTTERPVEVVDLTDDGKIIETAAKTEENGDVEMAPKTVLESNKEKETSTENLEVPLVPSELPPDTNPPKTANEDMEESSTEVGVISDSESSTEDFVDVAENAKVETVPTMEVVIKPDEEPEDDLFKDVFLNQTKSAEESQSEDEPITISEDELLNQNKQQTTPTKSKTAEGIERVFAEELSPEKGRPNIPSLYDKINKMIKTYSTIDDVQNTSKPELSVEQMQEMQQNLSKEQAELVVERSNKERLAGNITDQMYQEAQELLELFGVPYLIAPMEAEAQCAFLDLIDLTDGTITDDSDIWLFGGRTVYKNFFNQSKTVLEFKSESIQQHFKLTREQMILLAMLVGSDYTVGITGVGPVTALEILAAFPPKTQLLSGLTEFKSWFSRGKVPGPGRTALRGKLKNVSFTENFPNPQIAQAYLEPQVETGEEKFTWAKPDLVGLVDFAKQKFGWTSQKTEEILKPILKRLEERHRQKSIMDYYKIESRLDSGVAESKMSKRVKSAVTKIGKQDSVSDEEEPKPKKKRAVGATKKRQKEEGAEAKPKSRAMRSKNKVDEDVEVLKQVEAASEKKLEEIHTQIQKEVDECKVDEGKKKKVNLANLHKKEGIPQKQKEKSDMLRNKLKAIEAFRKSKQGPGFVKKRGKVVKAPKKDASYLSESSDSN